MEKGSFVVVKLTSEAGTVKYYLAQVLKVLPHLCEVQYLRCKKGKNEKVYVFPDIPDKSFVERNKMLKKVIATPQRRGGFLCPSLSNLKIE